MNSGCCSGFISLYDQSQVYWEAEVNTMACSSCEGLLQGSGYRNSSRQWLKEFGRRQVRGEEHYHNGNCQLLHQRKRGKSWRDGRNWDQQGAAPAPPSLNQEATCPRLTPSQADRTQKVWLEPDSAMAQPNTGWDSWSTHWDPGLGDLETGGHEELGWCESMTSTSEFRGVFTTSLVLHFCSERKAHQLGNSTGWISQAIQKPQILNEGSNTEELRKGQYWLSWQQTNQLLALKAIYMLFSYLFSF